MPYQVMTAHELTRTSGLVVERTTHAERLKAALDSELNDRGMKLVAIDTDENGNALYVFLHQTD